MLWTAAAQAASVVSICRMLETGEPPIGIRRGFIRFGDFAAQFDLQQSVVERRALDLDVVGKIERPRRDALIQELALLFLGLAAFDRQHILFGGDGDLVRCEAGKRQ